MQAHKAGAHKPRSFYRNGPDHRRGENVSFRDIVQQFYFYRIKIGRWVTAEEEQVSANLFFDALCDLQQILAVPPAVISMNGEVALTFGCGGQLGASAHYQPSGRILALTKNAGGGSLAHEWFHAFDHYIAQKLFPAVKSSRAFASSTWLQRDDYHPHALNQLLHKAYRTQFLNKEGDAANGFVTHCQKIDAANKSLYFSLPEELAARGFEKAIQTLPQKNHFLVSGCLQSETALAGLYPASDLNRELQSAWLTYFSALGNALDKQSVLA
ncbi:hypothetical protein CWE08_07010 [Aliidiomarina iranensis]|uniref:Large polyvalent protein-associated domain-containing protein n=1 Tax=Aliidiomarina iranensis TaxID=1434071 RepID=A0A432VWH0_9GAMM|nr:CLCA_X family protein [Aliidiomarina iranensis]RUO20844.1 hypothetical protein CWE08_07010 [Aliidiomarina iranensis]